jgi:hypothetical protein
VFVSELKSFVTFEQLRGCVSTCVEAVACKKCTNVVAIEAHSCAASKKINCVEKLHWFFVVARKISSKARYFQLHAYPQLAK